MEMDSTIPTDAPAANWPADILKSYLEDVEKDKQQRDEDEHKPTLTDESDSADESNTSDVSMVDDFQEQPADDIHSSDSAFSSDDEFTTDSARKEQKTRRELALGRPTPAILQARAKRLAELKEGYLKQIADADEELAELTGFTETGDTVLEELMKSSSMEVFDRQASVKQLVNLAQVLFRKEREIKKIHKERGDGVASQY
jgi:hypothetical protein